MVIDKLDPIVGVFELMNSKPGFLRSVSHFSHMVKSPISDVGQNLFLSALRILRLSYLSPSKNNTVSTICSRVLGHASAPSLLMCHIMKTAVPVVLA
jgi:hypothetical protein